MPTREIEPPVLAWLRRHVPPVVHAETLAGGYSNDNVLLVTESGERFVLRRYLRRNTCAMEAALTQRIRGTVPVPDVVAADPTGELAGQPVLLSRLVTGRPLSVALDATTARHVGETLAAVGRITFPYAGFFDGSLRPTGVEPTVGLSNFVEQRLHTGALTGAEQDGVRRLAQHYEPLLAAVAGSSRLVHADFNPKNILVGDDGTVAAVLDWEFAFSSTPLFDIGNLLRFEERYPPGFVAGFRDGFESAGGELPPGWRGISRGLDLFSLVDLLTRAPGNPYRRKATDLLRRHINPQ